MCPQWEPGCWALRRVCQRCCEPTVQRVARTKRTSLQRNTWRPYGKVEQIPMRWVPTRYSTWPRSRRTKATIVPFDPQLPWFRSLEGHPGYAQLLAERQRRIDEARTEMRALEAQYPDSEIVKTIQTAQR